MAATRCALPSLGRLKTRNWAVAVRACCTSAVRPGTKAEKIQVMTQQVALAFEDGLRDHSVDWHMMQPVWIADLDPSRRRT